MNYSKSMIDLISEARRRASSEDKPSIKLANPDVLFELNKIYHKSTDTVLKAIIKETFHLAGEGWPEKLVEPVEEEEIVNNGPRYITKVYRGQTQLIEVAPEGYAENKTRTDRVYRGQVVA
jgi:hypothetical protein